MRKAVALLSILVGGCAAPRWQVVPLGNNDGVILLDQATGRTWSRDTYIRPGEDSGRRYWRAIDREVGGSGTTKPTHDE